ncbi:MAG: MTAP family purine nucleoside phosphorylase [Actinomycetota bacterium]|nr:MTAP family purine nucleoside phosphorylase [Actinomycetota bacterium]
MRIRSHIPKAEKAFIGGSSTFSIDFPEDLGWREASVLEKELVFQTPFGPSPRFKLIEVEKEPVLAVKMHGWRKGVSRADASRQLFWVLQQAGVKKIIAEGGVGSIREELRPRDLIIPHDYIDQSMRKDVSLSADYLLIMREPICPDLSQLLFNVARNLFPQKNVVDGGVYVVTDGYHFESRVEVCAMREWGADIVGQSLCPEVYLAREIGACYAGIYQVVNYAEGIVKDWEHAEFKDIFVSEAKDIGDLLLSALSQIELKGSCRCQELRKDTLLRDK